MQVLILILLSRAVNTWKEKKMCTTFVSLPWKLRWLWNSRTETTTKTAHIEIITKRNFHPMWTRTTKMPQFLLNFDVITLLVTACEFHYRIFVLLSFFLLCSRCIFLKIILLFAPNKLPVNDWMSQETSAMPLLLNAIKIHACNNASSWMCYDFVPPFATKTPLIRNNHWSYLSVDTLSNANRPFWIIIINCAVAFILLT